jgi:predicted transcriptional regulator
MLLPIGPFQERQFRKVKITRRSVAIEELTEAVQAATMAAGGRRRLPSHFFVFQHNNLLCDLLKTLLWASIRMIAMKYRSRTDITAQVLEAANGGSTKTKIMYKAFLSYAQLKEYLSVLIQNGLLEYIEGEQIYKTTDKGNRFLKIYNQIGEYVAPDMEK